MENKDPRTKEEIVNYIKKTMDFQNHVLETARKACGISSERMGSMQQSEIYSDIRETPRTPGESYYRREDLGIKASHLEHNLKVSENVKGLFEQTRASKITSYSTMSKKELEEALLPMAASEILNENTIREIEEFGRKQETEQSATLSVDLVKDLMEIESMRNHE